MDVSKSGPLDIPDLKLIRSGKSRDRKRGGAAMVGSGAAKAGAGAGMSLVKTLITLAVVGGISTGAWHAGTMLSGGADSAVKPAAKKIFVDNAPQHYDDTSGVIKSATSIPNSTGYVSGSADGLTPEERAKQAADAEAARKAQEEADKKAQDDAAKQAQAQSAAPAEPQTAAANAGPKKLGKKFGSMSSGVGGSGGGGGLGLNGGSGLAGGISRNFGGVSGLGNRLLHGQSGQLSKGTKGAGPAGFSSAHAAVASRGHSSSNGMNQLIAANSLSRKAGSAGQSESASATAAQAFDNGIGQGQIISGGGDGTGMGLGNGVAATPANTVDPGGPMGGGGCADDGTCGNTPTPAAKNHFKYQYLITAVSAAMMAVAAISLLVMLEKHALKAAAVGSVAAAGIMAHIKLLLQMSMALGIVIAALGVTLMALTHDLIMSGIVAAVGAVIAYYSWASLPDITGSEDFITHSMMVDAQAIPAATGFMMSAGSAMMAQSIKPKINMD